MTSPRSGRRRLSLRASVPWRRAAVLVSLGLAGLVSLGLTGLVQAASPEAAAPALATQRRLDPADFERASEIHQVVVSPTNEHAAMIVENRDGRHILLVSSLVDPTQRKVVAAYGDVDIMSVRWVNSKRLVYTAAEPKARIMADMWGTFAIDRDGENERELINSRLAPSQRLGMERVAKRTLPDEWSVAGSTRDGSDDVYMLRWLETDDRGRRPQVLARVNTHTLAIRTLSEGLPKGAEQWLLDGEGHIRVVSATQKDKRQLWWRAGPDATWSLLQEADLLSAAVYEPVALEADGNIVVAARPRGDTAALHVFNPKTRVLDPEPLIAVPGWDVDSAVFDPVSQQVIGVRLDRDRPSWVWFDGRLASIQKAVDQALPDRSNALVCVHCVGAKRLVVRSTGDRQPAEYFVFDAEAGKLRPMGQSRPWIQADTQGTRSFHRVAARDGLSLPVVVTHPAGQPKDQPAPTIVLVHGGPWVDGANTLWESEPQFLASRGYRVLQVSFRGTTGLGRKHFEASFGQWGLSMQDDLADAVLWAVREKLTDPGRVCIYGASYGGYAALMGPVRHPELYRCAASHVGVTDISLLFSRNWTDMSKQSRRYNLPVLLGDPEKDAEKIQRQSPVNRAAEIKVPVLLVQGLRDTRVDPAHANAFERAARQAGVRVERVDLADEGHGVVELGTSVLLMQRLEAFFAAHLGPR